MSRAWCPHCGSITNRTVMQTNMVPADEAVYRRNHCPICESNFVTIEHDAGTVPKKKLDFYKHWIPGEEDDGEE